MNLHIKQLNIDVDNDGKATINGFPFVEAQVSGEDKDTHLGAKLVRSSQSAKLKYVSHVLEGNKLTVVQQSANLKTATVFSFGDYNGYSVTTSYTNVSDSVVCLEEASAFVLGGFAKVDKADKIKLYTFNQSHHRECQPVVTTLADAGFAPGSPVSQLRQSVFNVGSWSTKEKLPQGILDIDGKFVMFQLESNNSWYCEISDNDGEFYLYLGGKNLPFCGWSKRLMPRQTYVTNAVAVFFGNSLNSVVGEATKYRRLITQRFEADNTLPTIFNEYMHLSWDCPSEQNTRLIAPTVANLGIKYYVIDCGWHNEEDGKTVYPYVGQWKQSNARFPSGIRATTDYIRSLGMKAGLWIEPEIVGKKCAEMLNYYDDDCFIRRNGARVCVMGRYFLDFRNAKVTNYLTETIRRMIVDYGADYIKMDYNQDLGVGTDVNADSFGDGLEQCARAYLKWVDNVRQAFPNVLFETCSSGGMRMDYETLKHFPLLSTSDQTNYDKYPYVAGNMLSAVLPEQAAVWSYPVGSDNIINGVFNPTNEWMCQNVTDEKIVMNMVNSFLGRMHLASHLERLTVSQLALVREGVEYFDKMSADKIKALPYFPLGFTKFGSPFVVCGLQTDKKLYLAVWNMRDGNTTREIPVDGGYNAVKCAYPSNNQLHYELDQGILKINFNQANQARMFELKKTN